MLALPQPLSSLEQLFGAGNAFSLVERRKKVKLCVPDGSNGCQDVDCVSNCGEHTAAVEPVEEQITRNIGEFVRVSSRQGERKRRARNLHATVPEIPNAEELNSGVTGILDSPSDEPLHGETPIAVETETGYTYAMDITSSGADNQWEVLKHLHVDGYETQDAKMKRIKLETITSAIENRVAEEAKTSRLTKLSALDSVLSDYESDAEDQDKDWLDELIKENVRSNPPESPEGGDFTGNISHSMEAKLSPNFKMGGFGALGDRGGENHNGERKPTMEQSNVSSMRKRTLKKTRRRTAARILKREANKSDHDALDAAINEILDESWQGVKKRPGDPEGYPMLNETVAAIREQRTIMEQKKHANFVKRPDDPKGYPELADAIKEVENKEEPKKEEVSEDKDKTKAFAAIQGFLNLFAEKRGSLNSASMSEAAHASGLDPRQWEVIKAIVDSGASVPVIHPATGRGYELLESAASKAGVEYETAGGHALANLGRKRLAVLTQEGTVRGYQSECAEVTKSLQSVRALIKNRHAVMFGLGDNGDEHLIVNRDTGEVNWLEDDGINYIQSLMVIPPDKIDEVQAKMAELRGEQPFGRQGS